MKMVAAANLTYQQIHFFNFILIGVIFTSSCATTTNKRILTVEEQKKYQLFGVIHEARICPTVFNDTLKTSVVVGPCEIVSCNQVASEIKCTALPEKE